VAVYTTTTGMMRFRLGHDRSSFFPGSTPEVTTAHAEVERALQNTTRLALKNMHGDNLIPGVC